MALEYYAMDFEHSHKFGTKKSGDGAPDDGTWRLEIEPLASLLSH